MVLKPKPFPKTFIDSNISMALMSRLVGPTGRSLTKYINEDKPITPPPTMLEGIIKPVHPMELIINPAVMIK